MVPSPPAWPAVPNVPAALPAPTLPPLPELPVAPALAVELAVPAESPEAPAAVVPEQVTKDFQMPAAAPPVAEELSSPPPVVESRPVEPAVAPPVVEMPVAVAPVAAVPVVAAPVELPPAVEAPVAAVPVPSAAPELPFVPVPPREVAEEPSSPPPVVAESAPEAIPDLPFVPVPPRTIEETPTPVRVADVTVSPVVVGEVVVQETPAVVPEDSPWILAGAGEVPAVIAQPDLPQELRPPGVPLPRPGRLPKSSPPSEEPVLLAKLQEPLPRTLKPPPLLPAADPEPGVIYVLPFISLMVPAEVQERVFDQFVDVLNQRGAAQKLKFVIVKQGLDKTDRAWLAARKHAVGEIYGYVEESGCCSTDLRTRVRLTYYHAHQTEPALKYEYPVRTFFDHDRSTLVVERQKLADQIAAALVEEMFKALPP
jgi:hypothetical protein